MLYIASNVLNDEIRLKSISENNYSNKNYGTFSLNKKKSNFFLNWHVKKLEGDGL